MITNEIIDYQWNSGPMFEQWEKTNDLSPEESLWRTVVLVFLMDLQIDVTAYHESLNGVRQSSWHSIQNHMWVANDKWMENICLMAGLNYEKFLDIANEIVNRKRKIKAYKNYDS